jgi:integrase
MAEKTTRMKGPAAKFFYVDKKRYPGVRYLVTGGGRKIIYVAYKRQVDGRAIFEPLGEWGNGPGKWTPAAAYTERAIRKDGKSPSNAERRAAAKAKAEADARAAEVKAVSDALTFEAYATEWLARLKGSGAAPGTLDDYRSAFKVYAFPAFGKKPLAEITFADLQDFQNKTLGDAKGRGEKGLTAKRRNNIMTPIRALFNNAKERRDILENPAEGIKKVKEDLPAEIDPLSYEEVEKFLAAVDPWYRPLFRVALLTGAKPSELYALRWHDIDFTMGTVYIHQGRTRGEERRPKTNSCVRYVDLRPALYDALREHREANPDAPGDAYVFTRPDGTPLDTDFVRTYVWYPAIEKAGIRRRAMYQCRHSFASLMLQAGEDMNWVAKTLGHSTLAMVIRHYGKYVRDRARQDGARGDAGFTKALPSPVIEIEAVHETEGRA